MPKPKNGETRDDFMSRCIPIVMNEGTAEDNSQAAAMCQSMYDKKKNICNDCEGVGRKKKTTLNSTGGVTNDFSDCLTCNGTGEVD